MFQSSCCSGRLLAAFLAFLGALPASAAPAFTLFESGQVRPLALSPVRRLLFAVNTPDNRLEIFRTGPGGILESIGSVAVGLEPVAVAARSDGEVWVVNHLSDSVSVVDVTNPRKARVVRTLLVGDEPRDLVFAGPQHNRAFVTTAHRGQNVPFDPQLTTPGIGRADVWVFDATAPGDTLGGTPLAIVTLFSDTPRALAVSPDGARVYAAAFQSGNRTTTIGELFIPDGGEAAGGLPEPNTNFQGIPQPEVGLIVQFNGAHWVDTLGREWDNTVRFSLPDKDVFVLDAMADPPVLLPGPQGTFTGVGTILFNMAVNPVSGKVYVANTEANNLNRFEGPGTFAGSTLRGHLHESRITVIDGAQVLPRHLNKHIDYSTCCAPTPNAESVRSLAFPQGMAVTADGATLFVAAFGSSKIGVFRTAELESDTFEPDAASHIPVSGGGPSGLVLDEQRRLLYVLTRFDDAISVIDTRTRREINHVAMHNPEPPSVVNGRRFLYDATHTSSHGDSACASCHVFGDFDSLAWDLGNPDGTVLTNPGPFAAGPIVNPDFHPLKGPMATQSLRGMANHGPMHWRGDRTGGNDAPSAQPDSGSFDEAAAFMKFRGAFADLNGRHAPLPTEEMQAFSDFILQLTYPPNPIRSLDNHLTPAEQEGRDFFFGPASFVLKNCNGCHTLDPSANAGAGVAFPGFFGADGQSSFAAEPQIFKVPHLRNMYQKVGMFSTIAGPFMRDQVRGFGFLHDGSVDTLFGFVSSVAFERSPSNPDGIPPGPEGDPLRRSLERFMLAFDSNLAPIVGQQVTLTARNAAAVGPRIDLLEARAAVGECELVVKGQQGGREAGYLYLGDGTFRRDQVGAPPIPDAQLRQLAMIPRHELTFTCVPPGSGQRLGLDRDADGILDGDERD